MAHSPKHYTEMGRLVAGAGKRDWDELTAEYGAMLRCVPAIRLRAGAPWKDLCVMEENMKRLYLLLAIAGLILPYYFFVSFLLSYGLNLGMLIEQLFANQISTFFAVDLIITAVVFLIFSNAESKRLGIGNWWGFLVSTLLIGPSFSLPLFLYFREAKI